LKEGSILKRTERRNSDSKEQKDIPGQESEEMMQTERYNSE
jgi:hypothetical protein